jgi:hypothetical protein
MHVGAGPQQIIGGNAAENREQQHAQGDVPHPPKGGDVGGIAQVLRGKIPGIPG